MKTLPLFLTFFLLSFYFFLNGLIVMGDLPGEKIQRKGLIVMGDLPK